MEIILSLLIPILFVSYTYPVVKRFSGIDQLPLYIKLCFSLALGFALFIVTLSLWTILIPVGFAFIGKLYLGIMLALSGYAFWQTKHLFKPTLGQFKQFSWLSKQNKYTLILIAVYSLVYIFTLSQMPVASSDLVESYLPIARSIIKVDTAPIKDYYNGYSYVFPPIGTSVIYAFCYAITGNLNSAAFRFINLPFYFGFLVLSFTIFRRFLNLQLSLLGILLLITRPLMEDILVLANFYPDIIFGYYALLIITMLFQPKLWVRLQNSWGLVSQQGLALATIMLLKLQGGFIWLMAIIIFGFMFLPPKWKLLTILIAFPPVWFDRVVGPLFNRGSLMTLFIYQIILIGGFLFGLEWGLTRKEQFKIKYLFMAILAMLGLIFIIRNLYVFGGLEDVRNYDHAWINHIRSQMEIKLDGGSNIGAWSLFISPSLNLFFITPLVVGLWQALTKRKYYFVLFFISVYYSWWVIILGNASDKWIIPILPFLILLILLGLRRIISESNLITKVVWLSSLFMLGTSKFIFWNLGLLFFGHRTLRSIFIDGIPTKSTAVSSRLLIDRLPILKELGINLTNWFSSLVNLSSRIGYLLTSRENFDLTDIFYLMPLGLLAVFILIWLSRRLAEKLVVSMVVIAVLFSYGFIFYQVSDGQLGNFSRRERDLLYEYWGQSKYIEPYLKQDAKDSHVVLTFAPPTGLAYYTGLRILNLEYGYEMQQLKPIFYETDLKRIHAFLKQKGIKYIAIRYYAESINRFNKLKQITHIFDILDNPNYTQRIFQPENDNYWYLYKLI